MSISNLARGSFGSAFFVWIAIGAVQAEPAGTAQTDDVAPVNSGANPYRVIRDWAQLTLEKRPWGGSNGVAIDRDGKSVWATDRCSPGTAPGCLGTKANPVHHFDESGKEIRSFGGGMFVWPHGIHVDRDGNVWVTDARAPSADELKKFPGEDNKGSVVVKFSPEGKVLMTLGKPGVRGNPPEALTDPTDVVTDPEQWRRLRGREPYRRDGSQSGRAHLGVRQEREVPPDHRQDRNRARRVPHAARARVRFAGPADRRRPPQPSHPDPDEGREVRRRIRRLRPHQRAGHRQERRDLHGRLGVDRTGSPGLAAGASGSGVSKTAR